MRLAYEGCHQKASETGAVEHFYFVHGNCSALSPTFCFCDWAALLRVTWLKLSHSIPQPYRSATASSDPPKLASGPVPPKFDWSNFQSPMISKLRAIGVKTFPGKLDLLVYCPLKGRRPHCKSALITTNSVGKWKLCYAIPQPKSIIGVDMRCGKCKKHFTQSMWTPTLQRNRSSRSLLPPHFSAMIAEIRSDCGSGGVLR